MRLGALEQCCFLALSVHGWPLCTSPVSVSWVSSRLPRLALWQQRFRMAVAVQQPCCLECVIFRPQGLNVRCKVVMSMIMSVDVPRSEGVSLRARTRYGKGEVKSGSRSGSGNSGTNSANHQSKARLGYKQKRTRYGCRCGYVYHLRGLQACHCKDLSRGVTARRKATPCGQRRWLSCINKSACGRGQ